MSPYPSKQQTQQTIHPHMPVQTAKGAVQASVRHLESLPSSRIKSKWLDTEISKPSQPCKSLPSSRGRLGQMPWGVARWTPSAHPQCWTGCQTYPAAEAGCKHKQLTFFFTPCDVRVCWLKKSEKQDNITVKLSAVRNQSNIKIKIKYLLSQLSSHPFSAYTPNQTILHQPPAEGSNPEFLQCNSWLAISSVTASSPTLLSDLFTAYTPSRHLCSSPHTRTLHIPMLKPLTNALSLTVLHSNGILSSVITPHSMLPCFQYYVHILLFRLLMTL